MIVAQVKSTQNEQEGNQVASGYFVLEDQGIVDKNEDELGSNKKERVLGGGEEFVLIRDFDGFGHEDPINPGKGQSKTVGLKEVKMRKLKIDVLPCNRNSRSYKKQEKEKNIQIVHEIYSP